MADPEAGEPEDPETGEPGDLEPDWPVKAVRERLGLTQAEFAALLGTRQQTVSDWETGTRRPQPMSRRQLRRVAEDGGIYDAFPSEGAPSIPPQGAPPVPPNDGRPR